MANPVIYSYSSSNWEIIPRLIPENDADSAPGTVSTATHAVANITSGGVNVVNRTATAGSATNGIHQVRNPFS